MVWVIGGVALADRPREVGVEVNLGAIGHDHGGGVRQERGDVLSAVINRDHDQGGLSVFEKIAHLAELVFRDVVPEPTDDRTRSRPIGARRQQRCEEHDAERGGDDGESCPEQLAEPARMRSAVLSCRFISSSPSTPFSTMAAAR